MFQSSREYCIWKGKEIFCVAAMIWYQRGEGSSVVGLERIGVENNGHLSPPGELFLPSLVYEGSEAGDLQGWVENGRRRGLFCLVECSVSFSL